MDSRRDFTSKKVFSGYFSELGEKANSALLPATAMEEWRRLRGPDNLDCRHSSVTDSKQEVSDSNDFLPSFSQNRFSPQRYHF